MAFTILKNEAAPQKLKATIQRSGKLGFTDASSKSLKFGESSIVMFAQDDEDKDMLYLINNPVNPEEGTAFKVCKSGLYYYVNTKALFDSLKIDYETYTVIFDLQRDSSYSNMEVYKMKKRLLPRMKK